MKSISSIIEVTESSFGPRVLQSELPVLVAVYSEGSTAREMLALLEQWAPQASGLLRIFRLNAVDSSRLTGRFGVTSEPCLLLFNQGRMCFQFFGDITRRELSELLMQTRSLERSRPAIDQSERRQIESSTTNQKHGLMAQ